MQQFDKAKVEQMFLEAENMFFEQRFNESFDLFTEIIEMKGIDNEFKAESYNMLGAIVLWKPEIDPLNESGINYFKKALALDSNCISALSNIFMLYGDNVNNHQDFELFKYSIGKLRELNFEFSSDDFKKINKYC